MFDLYMEINQISKYSIHKSMMKNISEYLYFSVGV